MSTTLFPSGKAEHDYIVAKAKSLGLDPEAVLAVAAHEGVTLPAQVGDNGTSFGPWQLHQGGALPETIWQQGPEYAEQWANSPAGVDYALGRIQTVAGGLTGSSAIENIVSRFERPVDPAGEISRSIQTYATGGGPGGFDYSKPSSAYPGAGTAPLAGIPGGSQIEGAAGAVSSAVGSISNAGDLIKFVTSWRFAEIIGGSLLLLVGLVLLARSFGVTNGLSVGGVGLGNGSSGGGGGGGSSGPISEAPRRAQRRAGFTLEADRKPKRGDPGSAMLAPGDSLPY
jgi:hypothetical protein